MADPELREKIAKLAYQYAFLIDNKNIDEYWKRADKERWLDCANQILALVKEAGYVKLAEVPFDDLVREALRRKNTTYMEDATYLRPIRGRGHSSKSAELLTQLQVGDVKRIFHNDVFCHHPKSGTWYCGLSRTRDRLNKQGMAFHIYHEQEHVAIVARTK